VTKTKYGGLSIQSYLFNSGRKVDDAVAQAAEYLHSKRENLDEWEFQLTIPVYKRLCAYVTKDTGESLRGLRCYGLKLKVVDQDE